MPTTPTASTAPSRPWAPDAWRDCPIRQVPVYPDQAQLEEMERFAQTVIRRKMAISPE